MKFVSNCRPRMLVGLESMRHLPESSSLWYLQIYRRSPEVRQFALKTPRRCEVCTTSSVPYICPSFSHLFLCSIIFNSESHPALSIPSQATLPVYRFPRALHNSQDSSPHSFDKTTPSDTIHRLSSLEAHHSSQRRSAAAHLNSICLHQVGIADAVAPNTT